MWRMRLLFGFVVLLALGHLPQERGVLAQKYYMNFAFNNNNPDGDAGDGSKASPHNDGETKDHDDNVYKHDDTGDDTGIGGHEPGDVNEIAEGEAAGDAGGDAGEDLDVEGDDEGGYQGEDSSNSNNGNNENGNAAQQPTGGNDDDNDDSDSKDNKNRRRKLEEQENESLKRNRHSHHSSYEISIDDSFGGRYVRSIYESSESHGHSGSRANSNARDSGERQSSQEGKDQDNTNTADEPENPAEGVEVLDVTGGVGLARGGYNADYEEM